MTILSGPALLLFGMALGPHGLNVLTPSMVAFLDPAVVMGLAMLGVFVGLSVDLRMRGGVTFFAVGGLSALATVLMVGTGILLASRVWSSPDVPVWLLAVTLGLCAAASDSTALNRTNAEDFFVIVLGGAMVLVFRQAAPGSTTVLVFALAAIAVVIALAGWLLVDQTTSEREQHVFVLGSLLLLGGAAAYLSVSALLMGLIGGLIWNVADNVARDRMIHDLEYLQHPIVGLLLLVAGARVAPSLYALGLAIVYAVGRMASRSMAGSLPSRDARVELSSAGLIGLALTLEVIHVVTLPAWTEIALATVVIGTMIAEVLARLVPERPRLAGSLARGAAE